MTGLPKPTTPYASYQAFLHDVLDYGAKVPVRRHYVYYYGQAAYEIEQSFQDDVDPVKAREPVLKMVRGSSNLSCTGIVQLNMSRAYPVSPIEPERTSILRMGHLLHAEVYARLESGMPQFMSALVESPVTFNMDWWPNDRTKTTAGGTIDLVLMMSPLFLEAEEAKEWFADPSMIPQKCVADVKSCSTYLYPKYSKSSFEDPSLDLYGYVSQISLYSEELGCTKNGGFLLFINRDRPGDTVAVSPISGERLQGEVLNMKNRFEQSQEGKTFFPEKAARYTFKEVGKLCGNARKGEKGYCPHSETCMTLRANRYEF